jgi:hypothetical protein
LEALFTLAAFKTKAKPQRQHKPYSKQAHTEQAVSENMSLT